MKQKKCYIYIYLDPRKPGIYECRIENEIIKFDYEPFYVGRGKNSRSSDFRKHNPYCVRKLERIKEVTGENCIVQEFYCEEKDLNHREQMFITSIGRHNLGKGPLTNLTDGGEGLTNISEETRKKCNTSDRRIYNRGYKRPVWINEKVRLGIIRSYQNGRIPGMKGKHQTEEAKIKVSICNLGKSRPGMSRSEEEKNHLRDVSSKTWRVLCYKEFDEIL